MAFGGAPGSNTVSFVAAVPNGGTNLEVVTSGYFAPGVSEVHRGYQGSRSLKARQGVENIQWVTANLGVAYTVV